MLAENYFEKKFSIGLAMNTTVNEFEEFLGKYSFFIENIYVSPPLGDQFHGREHIRKQFQDPDNVTLFWKLIDLIQKYHISLEVVFNTEMLQIDDFQRTKEVFEQRDIKINKIALFDRYFSNIKKLFPDSATVKTVNEMPNTIEAFEKITVDYDEIVVGRQFIREKKVLQIIKEGLKVDPVLLLNNGCSFHCGGCQKLEHCEDTYVRDRKKWGSEYLYAQQSILPYELHEGYLDLSDIALFKLSTRNADTEFMARCLESYIKNNAEELVKDRSFNYLLWARLGWHIEYFDTFDYGRILRMKTSIYDEINRNCD